MHVKNLNLQFDSISVTIIIIFHRINNFTLNLKNYNKNKSLKVTKYIFNLIPRIIFLRICINFTNLDKVKDIL